jgi:acetyl esterase/lipase
MVGLAILIVLAAAALAPWPGALLIRWLFERDGARVGRALRAHAPAGVETVPGLRYRADDRDALLDVHVPAGLGPDERLPAVIWTHGGAWLSGSRTDVVPYLQLIAAEGYAVVALDYSLAPAATYPTPVLQVNDALAYVRENAGELHVDAGRLVLGGDSAGAQITSQVAALATNPGYAAEFGVAPSIEPSALRGVILHCGFYDLRTFVERGAHAPVPFLRWGIRTMVHAYTGSRALDRHALAQMSTIDHVTPAFPPAFIGGGNADPLTDAHSRPFAARLRELGVDVSTLFYEADHQPPLGHEYQFDLDAAEGKDALARTIDFLRAHTSEP